MGSVIPCCNPIPSSTPSMVSHSIPASPTMMPVSEEPLVAAKKYVVPVDPSAITPNDSTNLSMKMIVDSHPLVGDEIPPSPFQFQWPTGSQVITASMRRATISYNNHMSQTPSSMAPSPAGMRYSPTNSPSASRRQRFSLSTYNSALSPKNGSGSGSASVTVPSLRSSARSPPSMSFTHPGLSGSVSLGFSVNANLVVDHSRRRSSRRWAIEQMHALSHSSPIINNTSIIGSKQVEDATPSIEQLREIMRKSNAITSTSVSALSQSQNQSNCSSPMSIFSTKSVTPNNLTQLQVRYPSRPSLQLPWQVDTDAPMEGVTSNSGHVSVMKEVYPVSTSMAIDVEDEPMAGNSGIMSHQDCHSSASVSTPTGSSETLELPAHFVLPPMTPPLQPRRRRRELVFDSPNQQLASVTSHFQLPSNESLQLMFSPPGTTNDSSWTPQLTNGSPNRTLQPSPDVTLPQTPMSPLSCASSTLNSPLSSMSAMSSPLRWVNQPDRFEYPMANPLPVQSKPRSHRALFRAPDSNMSMQT